MKSAFLRIVPAAMALLAAGACSSGADAPEVPPTPPAVKEPCSFNMVLNLSDNRLRATQSEGYDPGEGYENYIDVAQPDPDIRLSIFGTDNIWITDVASPLVTALDYDGKGSRRFLLEFDLSADLVAELNGKSFKLMMLANFDRTFPANVSGSTVGQVFDNQTIRAYTSLPGPELKASDKISMYGICRYNNVVFDPRHSVSLGTLHLLRAIAKIEVCAADGSVKNISKVELTRHNTKSYSVPRGIYEQTDYVKGSYEGDYIGTTSIPPDCESGEPVELEYTIADGKRHYIIYVPEYNNLNGNTLRPDSERARLRITYEDGQSFYVDFRNEDGDIMNIYRNYWYRFTLRRVQTDIEAEVDVMPYGIVDLDPIFGLD